MVQKRYPIDTIFALSYIKCFSKEIPRYTYINDHTHFCKCVKLSTSIDMIITKVKTFILLGEAGIVIMMHT